VTVSVATTVAMTAHPLANHPRDGSRLSGFAVITISPPETREDQLIDGFKPGASTHTLTGSRFWNTAR
jgi:hypothetical protein